MNELKSENIIIQVRDKLQKDGVRLWQSPYYLPTGPSVHELNRLAQDYSIVLNLPYESCYSTIYELQSFALEKLKQRDLYRASGIATLRIKILNQNKCPVVIMHEICLKQSGCELKKAILEQENFPQERLKLIANGKVVQEDQTLLEQGIYNGQQVLALFMNESLTELQQSETQYKEIEAVKADTHLLASEDNDYMELEDQSGNPITMPMKERQNLMIAIALHEKGRTALKREDYSRALVFFLDSDNQFSQCNSDVLNLVDNYALLDLDIVWCYLCLRSVNHLPEAYDRLNRCEKVFERSYGPSLERLIALKGSPGNEGVLLLRLHLLQAIVLFHQNKRQDALKMFEKVEDELRVLKVDENSIIRLMELGYSTAEARLGLRATRGDINAAANYINENRDKRAESRRKAMAQKLFFKEQKKLGKCVDGKQYVNPTFLKMLIEMGYNKESAIMALQKCNNVISDSIQYIQENPTCSASRSQERMSSINDLIPEFEAAGFDQNTARKVLKKYGGDITQAINELLSNNNTDMEDKDDENENRTKKLRDEAYNRLAKDICMIDDDHLDYTLLQEEQFFKEYMTLLKPK